MINISPQAVIESHGRRLRALLRSRFATSDIARRFASGAFWSLVGTLISRAMLLVAYMVAARIVGQQAFGELGMIRCTVETFGVFAGLGLGLTTTKHVAEFRRTDPIRAGRIIMLSCFFAFAIGAVFSVAVIALAPTLAASLLNAPHLGTELRIGGLLLGLNVANGVLTGTLAGFEAFRRIASIHMVVGLLTFPLISLGAWIFGVNGILYAMLVTAVVQCLLSHGVLRTLVADYQIPMGLSGMFSELRVLWSFSIPASMSQMMVVPVNWICAALLVHGSDGYREFGAFSAANQWFAVLLLVPSVVGAVLLPLLSEQLKKGDELKCLRVLKMAVLVNGATVLPIACLGIVMSPWIMRAYGEDFAPAWPVLVTALATACLLAIQQPIGQLLAASGRMWLAMLMNMGWGVCYVFAAWMLRDFGAGGLAIARLIAYLLHTTWVAAFAICFIRTQCIVKRA